MPEDRYVVLLPVVLQGVQKSVCLRLLLTCGIKLRQLSPQHARSPNNMTRVSRLEEALRSGTSKYPSHRGHQLADQAFVEIDGIGNVYRLLGWQQVELARPKPRPASRGR